MIRLYGYANGENSFSQVTRGMRRALDVAGELDGFCPLDDEAEMDGVVAEASLNIGEPSGLLRAHRDGDHRSHWLLLAPNGETLPFGFMGNLRKPSKVLPRGMLTGGLLAPSGWAASVLRRYIPDYGLPVIVAPHGVMPEVHRTDSVMRLNVRLEYRGEAFNVLHMTSSETDRKGTQQLLRAWKESKKRGAIPEKSRLYVVMNPTHMSRIRWWCADLGLTEFDVPTRPGLIENQAAIVKLYSSMHAVCQPSRGEGFGLVPLEALACGVPVCATACTGHSEYLQDGHPGVAFVEHGSSAPMDDFPGSTAPSVSVDAIMSGLTRLYANWMKLAEMAEANAKVVRTEWAWERKNAVPIRQMVQSIDHKETNK